MIQKGTADDPKGLIFEAFRMPGITKPECRTIFLDWALSLPDGREATDAIANLLGAYGAEQSDHPMTDVLREGQEGMARPKRRGGWRSRNRAGGPNLE